MTFSLSTSSERNEPMGDDWAAWENRLQSAIDRFDDADMWRVMAENGNEEEANNTLAEMLPRYQYRQGKQVMFAEMLLIPVIELEGHKIIEDDGVWGRASYCLAEAVHTWATPWADSKLFKGVRPFEYVNTWQPQIMRHHLRVGMEGVQTKPAQMSHMEMDLPPGAPRLGFLRVLLTSNKGWPGNFRANSVRDTRLRNVVQFALDSERDIGQCLVMPPETFSAAVTDGVCAWLMKLNEFSKITGWVVTPSRISRDVIKITLALESEQVPFTQFVLRPHQMGMQGIQDVVSMLIGFAPPMDPMHDGHEKATKGLFEDFEAEGT